MGSWGSFDVPGVSSFLLVSSEDGGLQVELEPEGERMALERAQSSAPAFLPLTEPDAGALAFARQASAWTLAGETEEMTTASVFRPVRGSYSQAGWAERSEFIANRVGGEVRVIEEAWVLREGTWRYWRTFESTGGVEIVLRFGVTADQQVLSFGINPRGSEPEFDEKRIVSPAG